MNRVRSHENACMAKRPVREIGDCPVQWWGYLSSDRKTVLVMILVDYRIYEDGAIRLSVPVLGKTWTGREWNMSAYHAASLAVQKWAEHKTGQEFEPVHERQFETVAYQKETTAVRFNIPRWWEDQR